MKRKEINLQSQVGLEGRACKLGGLKSLHELVLIYIWLDRLEVYYYIVWGMKVE